LKPTSRTQTQRELAPATLEKLSPPVGGLPQIAPEPVLPPVPLRRLHLLAAPPGQNLHLSAAFSPAEASYLVQNFFGTVVRPRTRLWSTESCQLSLGWN
jgi:hypothetical protein